jgi:hypothetical protein
MRARSGEQLGVGIHGDQHLVATVPRLGALIDFTLFPAIRYPWDKLLSGMWALRLEEPTSFKIFDRRLRIAAIADSDSDQVSRSVPVRFRRCRTKQHRRADGRLQSV